MDPNLKLLLAAANDTDPRRRVPAAGRGRFGVEFDRRGVFVRFGRRELYLCTEPDSAWTFLREPGGFDAQAWRLHLIVAPVPG
ncbi:MAG TPA: hypothetical protein VGN83_04130 [Falsiroseomonas sp.]|jgi:hypothetical protein|nr:hypothetical protein [Falsiroseomonas sp.]